MIDKINKLFIIDPEMDIDDISEQVFFLLMSQGLSTSQVNCVANRLNSFANWWRPRKNES